MKRIYKPIPNTDKLYWVSNDGIIQSRHFNKKKILHQSTTTASARRSGGHKRVTIFTKQGKKKYLVHRLVAQAFIPNPNNYPQINHIDGVKSNNHYSNLEWCTQSMNTLHSYHVLGQKSPNNTWTKGENNPGAKLTKSQVIEIRNLRQTSKLTQEQIAKLYNVSRHCILKILNNKSWQKL